MQENQELPQGWEIAKLADVMLPVRGIAFPKEAKRYTPFEDHIACLRTTNVQKEVEWGDLWFIPSQFAKREEQIIQPLDILISTANSYELVGKVAQVHAIPHKATLGAFISLLRVQAPFDAKFFYHYLSASSTQEAIRGFASTTTNISNVSTSKLATLDVIVPPLPEQRRIVAKLEELFSRLDAGVATLRHTQAQLKRYRQAVLHAAVTGELTRAWREAHPHPAESGAALLQRIRQERRAQWEVAQQAKRGGQLPLSEAWKTKYEEPAAPDTSELPELPQGWAWVALPELGELSRGKSKHRPRDDKRLYDGPYPFIQTGDVRHANGVIKTHSQTYSELGLSQSRLWPTGTLCITIAANIADTALLGFDACFPDSVVGFLTDADHCNIKFIELFLRTAKENIERFAPATAQKNINLEILSKVGVPLPPLDEQTQIIAEAERHLSVIDDLEHTLTAELTRAERLRQSILHRAFTGRLVPQDAADEPAAALLERLRGAAAAAPAKGRRGRKAKESAQINLSF